MTTSAGGIVGLLGTHFALQGLNHVIATLPQLKWILGDFQPQLSVTVVVTVLIILLLVGCVSGAVPAYRAASIPPSEALRQ